MGAIKKKSNYHVYMLFRLFRIDIDPFLFGYAQASVLFSRCHCVPNLNSKYRRACLRYGKNNQAASGKIGKKILRMAQTAAGFLFSIFPPDYWET